MLVMTMEVLVLLIALTMFLAAAAAAGAAGRGRQCDGFQGGLKGEGLSGWLWILLGGRRWTLQCARGCVRTSWRRRPGTGCAVASPAHRQCQLPTLASWEGITDGSGARAVDANTEREAGKHSLVPSVCSEVWRRNKDSLIQFESKKQRTWNIPDGWR